MVIYYLNTKIRILRHIRPYYSALFRRCTYLICTGKQLSRGLQVYIPWSKGEKMAFCRRYVHANHTTRPISGTYQVCAPEKSTKTSSLVLGTVRLEERSDDALCRAPAVPGILPQGKIVEGEKAAGEYEGAAPPVLRKPRLFSQGFRADEKSRTSTG